MMYILFLMLIFGVGAKSVIAQDSPSVLYVPLIGITSVPDPLAMPNGPKNVTYKYAVKNFLPEVPLTDIQVIDDKCSPIKFVTGDDNGDFKLDYSETWRYTCLTRLYETTQSIAVATGHANSITATHKAYATVVVGQKDPAPLVSIINITKVAYPLSLPAGGGAITFTYRVSNPGEVPLSKVTVTDDKCSILLSKLGDINANNLLDTREVWVYTCTTHLKETTTNTVNVTAFANGLKAVDDTTITVHVDIPPDLSPPSLPDTRVNPDLKITVWKISSGILVLFIIFFVLTHKNKRGKTQKKRKNFK